MKLLKTNLLSISALLIVLFSCQEKQTKKDHKQLIRGFSMINNFIENEILIDLIRCDEVLSSTEEYNILPSKEISKIVLAYIALKMNQKGIIDLNKTINSTICSSKKHRIIRAKEVLLHSNNIEDINITDYLKSFILHETGKDVGNLLYEFFKSSELYFKNGKLAGYLSKKDFFLILQYLLNADLEENATTSRVPVLIGYRAKKNIEFGWNTSWFNGVKVQYVLAQNNTHNIFIIWFPENKQMILHYIPISLNIDIFLPHSNNLSSSILFFNTIQWYYHFIMARNSKQTEKKLELLNNYSKAFFYKALNLNKQAKKQYSCFIENSNVIIPEKHFFKNPALSINKIQNNTYKKNILTVDNPGHFYVVSVGEGRVNNNENMDIGYSDNIEFYFSLKSSCQREFNTLSDDKQYIFSANYPKVITGIHNSRKGIQWSFTIKNQSHYFFEAFFPFETIGPIPTDGKPIGFDIKLTDNDYDGIDKVVGLADPNPRQDPFPNGLISRSRIGNLFFNVKDESKFVAYLVNKGPQIDGKKEQLWGHAKKYKIDNIITGYPQGKNDIKGSVKFLYSTKGLYVFLDVYDEQLAMHKNNQFDYAFIRNKHTGEKIWEMDMNRSLHAGGELMNRWCDTTIFLQKGVYEVCYISDDGNSPEGWYGQGPLSPLYGINVFKNE